MENLVRKDIVIIDIGKHYPQNSDIRKLFVYIAGKNRNKQNVRYYGGRGVSKNPWKAAENMIKIQKYFNKDKQRRIYHFVVSFSEKIEDVNCIKLVAENLAEIFWEKYQVYYGVHEDTTNLHIHFAVNAVSYLDGKKWHQSKKEFEKFKHKLISKASQIIQENKVSF